MQVTIIISSSLIILFTLLVGFVVLTNVFTQVKTGTQQFVIHGEKYYQTLEDVLGNSVWAWFGYHRVGFSFLNYSIKSFFVDTDKENKKPDAKDMSTWVITGEPREVNHLRKEIPRVLIASDLELGSREPLQVAASFPLVLETIDGVKFVFFYNASFTNPTSIILSAIRVKIASFTSYESLIKADADFLQSLVNDTSLQSTLANYGLRLKEIKMAMLATDKAVEEASKKKLVAELELEAEKINAQKTITLGKAEAKVIALKAAAEIQGRMNAMGRNLKPSEKREILAQLMIASAIEKTNVTNLTLAGDVLKTLNLNNN